MISFWHRIFSSSSQHPSSSVFVRCVAIPDIMCTKISFSLVCLLSQREGCKLMRRCECIRRLEVSRGWIKFKLVSLFPYNKRVKGCLVFRINQEHSTLFLIKLIWRDTIANLLLTFSNNVTSILSNSFI